MLRRVTDDRDLSIGMQARRERIDVLPKQNVVRLLAQRRIRIVVRMHEKVLVGFEEPDAVPQEAQVVLRNILDSTAVASQSRVTAMSQPEIHVLIAILQGFEHHDLVIADQRNKPAIRHQVDQRFNDLVRLHAAINVIAQADYRVLKRWPNFSKQHVQRSAAAVNVANGNDA